MSNHNYSQYSNNKKHRNPNYVRDTVNAAPVKSPVAPIAPVVETVKPATEVVIPMVETVETVTLPKTVDGVVTGCSKLNVRANPTITADVVCVMEAMSEVEIDVEKSTFEWFHVCTAAGIEGYCMRKFVEAHL